MEVVEKYTGILSFGAETNTVVVGLVVLGIDVLCTGSAFLKDNDAILI